MSTGAFLEESDLIAVVDVSRVHEVTTPEGFRLQSAKAKIIRVIYWRFPDDPEMKDGIVIYSLDPNAAIVEENISGDGLAFPVREGRAFVCLKMKGINKFYPYAPLCFQPMNDSEMVSWPSEPIFRAGMKPYSPTPLSTVIEQLDGLQKAGQSEPDS